MGNCQCPKACVRGPENEKKSLPCVVAYCAEQEKATLMPAPLAITLSLMAERKPCWWYCAPKDVYFRLQKVNPELKARTGPSIVVKLQADSNGYVQYATNLATASYNGTHESGIIWCSGTTTQGFRFAWQHLKGWQPLDSAVAGGASLVVGNWSVSSDTANGGCCVVSSARPNQKFHLTADGLTFVGTETSMQLLAV